MGVVPEPGGVLVLVGSMTVLVAGDTAPSIAVATAELLFFGYSHTQN